MSNESMGAVRIVREAWPDEVEIAGGDALERIAAGEVRFERPKTGDHIDLAPILEVLKGAVELVAAGILLYQTVRGKDKPAQAEAELRLSLTRSQADGVPISDEQIEIVVRRIASG